MWKCAKCNKGLVWQCDYTYEDVGVDDKDGIVAMYQCEPCGVWVEIYEDILDGEQVEN